MSLKKLIKDWRDWKASEPINPFNEIKIYLNNCTAVNASIREYGGNIFLHLEEHSLDRASIISMSFDQEAMIKLKEVLDSILDSEVKN